MDGLGDPEVGAVRKNRFQRLKDPERTCVKKSVRDPGEVDPVKAVSVL
jgi:hypothetical protein